MTFAQVKPLPAWRTHLQDRHRLPPGLVSLLDEGRPALLVARASSPSGRKARDAAAKDAEGVVEELAKFGLDYGAALPSREKLMLDLERASSTTSTTAEGTPFTNRYCIYDLRAAGNLVLLVSTGTGSSLDQNGDQPFVRRSAELVREFDAALVFGKRGDRRGRHDWGLAPLMIALQTVGGYLGDDSGIAEVDDAVSTLTFIKGIGAKNQAKAMPRQTRREQVKMTADRMIGGQADYHIGSPVPPGLDVCWLTSSGPKPAQRIAFLDMPGCRPEPERIAFGASKVMTEEKKGQPRQVVDQVANVRFVLSHYGRKGWTHERLVNELIVRRFSSQHLRGLHGSGARILTLAQGRTIVTSVLKNLPFYETGTLHREVGGDTEGATIEGCLPPDGPWALPADFSRIRTSQRDGRARKNRSVRLTFVGVRATWNGQSVVMQSDRAQTLEGIPTYACVKPGPTPRRPKVHIPLPASAWSESILEGIRHASSVPLQMDELGDLRDDGDEVLAALLARRELARSQSESVSATMSAVVERLEQTDGQGRLILDGALLATMQARYNELDKKQRELDLQLVECARAIDDRLAQQPDDPDVSALLLLAESLLDPTERRYRALWLATIVRLHFTSERYRHAGRDGRRLSWQGALRFTESATGVTIYIPFYGMFEVGAATREGQRLQSASEERLRAMQSGQPLRVPGARVPLSVRSAVAERLGVPVDHAVLDCDDPTILRVMIRLLLEQAESPDEVAEALNVDVRLVGRVASLLDAEPAAPWYAAGSSAAAALYAIAAVKDGRAAAADAMSVIGGSLGQIYNIASHLCRSGEFTSRRKAGYDVTPCSCGSVDLVPVRIAVVAGPVCMMCRRDRGGLRWPSDPYDKYIAYPEIRAAAAHGRPEA